MQVRMFDWRDLTTLHRHRQKSIFLDTTLVLTRGKIFMPGALLSYFAPLLGVITCVSSDRTAEHVELIGQVMHNQGSPLAYLTFITPESSLHSNALAGLLEYLAVQAGERGAQRLMADVNENETAYQVLYRNNFAVFTRQRIWKFENNTKEASPDSPWHTALSKDAVAIQSLYNDLVPGLVKQVEPCSSQNPHGLVLYRKEKLLAYVELKYGHRGIWVQPFVHPETEETPDTFRKLVQTIPDRFARPVYICVRSYQSWLESTLEALGAEVMPRQAVMVKHMAIPQIAEIRNKIQALDKGQPEISAPISRTESK